MFEHRQQPVLSRKAFALRIGRSVAIALAVLTASLGIGTCGYRAFGQLPWLDAFLNASMILTGMGPVSAMTTPAAKLFASAYAIFSGVVFLTVMGVVAAPLVHRFLHKFHLGL